MYGVCNFKNFSEHYAIKICTYYVGYIARD